MKAKEIESVGYSASSVKTRPINVYSARQKGETCELVIDAKTGIFGDDTFEQEFTPTQWENNPYKESILRDEVLGYLTVDRKKQEGNDNIILYIVKRPYRRLSGCMSVNSLLAKSKQMNGHKELKDIEGLVFSNVSGEKDLQQQVLAKARDYYKWTAESDMRIIFEYRGDHTLDITPKDPAKKSFKLSIPMWEFAPIPTATAEPAKKK